MAKIMEYPKELIQLVDLFRTAKQNLYLIGGCTRDFFLNKTPHDWDLVCDVKDLSLLESLIHQANDSWKILKIGKAYNILTIVTQNNSFEIGIFRKDEYTDDSLQISTGDIYSDVSRRDFTINAIYYDLGCNRFIDLVDGEKDIKNRVIRTVGNPKKRFTEDPLRKLRAFRFYASFSDSFISLETELALFQDKSLNVSKERIRQEWIKILKSPFFPRVYTKMGIEYVSKILPDFILEDDIRIVADNYLLLLAYILKKNLISKLVSLKKLAYSNNEIRVLNYLFTLLNFTSIDIYNVKRMNWPLDLLSDKDVELWCNIINKPNLYTQIQSFPLANPEIMREIEGKTDKKQIKFKIAKIEEKRWITFLINGR